MDTPTIGRIIHVVGDELLPGEHIAAIVTKVNDEKLWVTAFIPGTVAIPTQVGILDQGTEPGQWHWPERVEVTPSQPVTRPPAVRVSNFSA
jgi:hypothetical protein